MTQQNRHDEVCKFCAKHLSMEWIFLRSTVRKFTLKKFLGLHSASFLKYINLKGEWDLGSTSWKGNLDSRYSGFWHFVITHLNATISICCDMFRRIGMRPRGWRVPFGLCFALKEVRYFHLVLQSLNVFILPVGVCISLNSVPYPGILFGGGGVQQIQLRTEDREYGDLGAVAP